MKLEMLYTPTSDLEASLTVYRDAFGAQELWREGESTAALSFPGTDVQMMLDASDPNAPGGPMFTVDSVATFHDQRHQALHVVDAPSEIPGGFMATYQDAGGTTIYVLDQSTDATVS